MSNVGLLARVAALVGEPARAAMLVTLMDGRAFTAGELGRAAGIAPPTASGHLAQMLDAGLLALERQGRHRYYRLATPAVAGLLESLMALSGELDAGASGAKPIRTGPRDLALRRARLCYDHLAGEVAVAIADAMTRRDLLVLGPDGGTVTEAGQTFLAGLGIALAGEPAGLSRPVPVCRPCLDWSERRLHIAGGLGRSLYTTFVERGWMRQPGAGRAVSVTPLGAAALQRHFGIEPA